MHGSADKRPKRSQGLCAGLALSLLMNVLVIGCVLYGGYHFKSIHQELKGQIASLKRTQMLLLETQSYREKRDVVHIGDKTDPVTVLRGPPGLPGRDGRDGRDGKDFASLDILQDVVEQEWMQFSSKLPHYAGAVYTRWGRTVCPTTSKLIYRGFMAGPDYRAAGGGANYQCLPSDPEYVANPPNVPHAAFTSVWYHSSVGNTFIKPLSWQSVPCSVCEVNQGVTKIMIPAKTSCPTGNWTLQYKGFVMTAADQVSPKDPIEDKYFKGTYECIDELAEGAPYKPVGTNEGAPIYTVKADCDKFYQHCPPYQSGKAISCVVCSK